MKKSNMCEEKGASVIGTWRDEIIFKDGSSRPGEGGVFEWKKNQIQNSFSLLLAALCRGEVGVSGITAMAFGSGHVSWDSAPPTKARSATSLLAEYYRVQIPLLSKAYLDPDTNLPTGGTISRKVEFSAEIGYGEGIGVLREFGLFGGEDTTDPNSGTMVNWVSHGRIDKDSSMRILRKVRLEFQLP